MTDSTIIPADDAKALLELGLSDEIADAALLDAVRGRLPGLEVEEVLGRGGMGVVYLARQRSLERQVAVKVLNPELARRPEFAARFQQEAQILASLRHPGIVEVYDVSETDGLFYIVMAPVLCGSLREQMLERMPAKRVRWIVRHLCEALAHAHGFGVVHRDIKPENILVDERGTMMLADFGLAKLLSGPNLSLTATLTAAGTLLYMAPEQLEGRGAVGPATDLYSLGVLAYELLTGRLPVGRFRAPSQEGADSSELDDIVMTCLERDPQRRFASAAAMIEALDGATEASVAPVARPSRPFFVWPRSLAARWQAEHEVPIWFTAGFPALMAAGVLAGIALQDDERPRSARSSAEAKRECITAHGQTACGYDCIASEGEVGCAPQPGMECVASEDRIACGYRCARADGEVACAPHEGMNCVAARGEVHCGYHCRSERGGVVCDAEAVAPWEPTGIYACDTLAAHLRRCELYDDPQLGEIGRSLDMVAPRWRNTQRTELEQLCRGHYKTVVLAPCG